MSVFHVTRQGSALHVKGNLLEVWADDARIARARLPLLHTLVVHGGVSVTTPALTRLLQHEVDVVFLTADGRFKGRVETLGSRAAELRTLQAKTSLRHEIVRALAASIIGHKMVSQERVVRALRGELPRPLEWHLRRLRSAGSLDEVRGLEGFATRGYFDALRRAAGLPDRWVRARRPPPDGINALLSYGYALLQSRVHAAVTTIGLDPWLGFLHEVGRPRPALVLDLMEEFRAPVVDFLVVRFVREVRGSAWWMPTDEGVQLSEEARKAFITRFEARLQRETMHSPTATRTTLARCIELQVRAVASAIRGDSSTFGPFHRRRR